MANLAGVVVSVVPSASDAEVVESGLLPSGLRQDLQVVPPASNAGVVEDYAAKVKDLENQVVPPVSDAGVVERGGRRR